MSALQKLDGAIIEDYDPFAHVIQSPSPSFNFIFGKSWGLPQGFTMALAGPPKGGKTILCNLMAGQLHKDDPDALVIKFDTELREVGQMTARDLNMYGIDKNRYLAYGVNSPSQIFDRIEKDIAAKCQDGAPIKLIIIDSLFGIQGRRSENADSIDVQQIGDHALTIQEGLKRILKVQRDNKIALILTTQVRAEMDQLEQKRGNKIKMQAPFAVQHYCEYFVFVEQNRNKEGRSDLSGNEFLDDTLGDIQDNSERTGHKIRIQMKDSSLGPKGRRAEFTLDYNLGIVNVFEEIFLLGLHRGVIEKPNNVSYVYKDRKWAGKQAILDTLKEDVTLQAKIIEDLKRMDLGLPPL
jgi:RecA/RadA recombinase